MCLPQRMVLITTWSVAADDKTLASDREKDRDQQEEFSSYRLDSGIWGRKPVVHASIVTPTRLPNTTSLGNNIR